MSLLLGLAACILIAGVITFTPLVNIVMDEWLGVYWTAFRVWAGFTLALWAIHGVL